MKSLVWIVPCGCFFMILSTLIWAIPRGLDFTDEGFYLVHLNFPDRYPTLYGFGNIYQSVLGWCCKDILHWRVAKLVQGILGGMIFAFVVAKFIPRGRSCAHFWALLCLNFVSFSLYLQTISYNDLNNFLAIISSVAVLWRIKTEQKIIVFALLLGGGICLGLNFFNKATSSLSLLGLSFIFLFSSHYFQHSPRRASLLKQILALFLGYLIGLCIFFSFIKPFDSWVKDYIMGMEASATYMDSISVWLGKYLKYLVRAVGFVVVLVLPWSAVGYVKKYRAWAISLATIWTLTGVYQTQLILGGEKAFSKHSLVYLSVIFLQLIALTNTFKIEKCSLLFFVKQHKQDLSIVFFLFFVPFACALGSTNSLTRQASFHLVFWGGVILLLNSISSNWQWMPTVLSVLVLIQITTGTLNPYSASAIVNPEHPITLQEQTKSVANIPELRGIKLDSITSVSLFQLRQITDSLRLKTANQAIFYDLPTLNYLTAMPSPGTEWYYFLYEPHNCYIVSKLKLKTLPLFAFLAHRKPGKLTQESLSQIGIKPDEFKTVMRLAFPTQSDTLQLLVPRR